TFLNYDDLFDRAPRNLGLYRRAVTRLLASGLVYGLGDLFGSTKGVLDLPEHLRWTVGMLAQWAADNELRRQLRRRVIEAVTHSGCGLICAHSLGSLGCYDALRRRPAMAAGSAVVTCGSQLGSPFVRECFGGRIEPLGARHWYQLYNPHDHALASRLHLDAS